MIVENPFLNVLAIIAFVVAIAIVLVLLVDLVICIFDKRGSILFGRRESKNNNVEQKTSQDVTVTEIKEYTERPQVLPAEENTVAIRKPYDEEEANQEQQNLLEQTEEETKDFSKERRESIDRRRKEFEDFDNFDDLFDEEPVKEENSVESVKEDDFDSLIDEINNDSLAEYRNSSIVSKETTVELPEEEEVLQVSELESMNEEEVKEPELIQITETMTEEPNKEIDELEEEVVVEEKPVIVNIYESFPLQLLEARLETLQARLKINERDLKANRKEYNPLAKVAKSLARDQEKLRRREAVIARKKVLLYGVNNYVDIDEEKAKKLSEDLDLLDGLRLSVQHCEEVMEANKERFPILSKTNEILVENNKDLKDDIAEVMAAIANMKNNK